MIPLHQAAMHAVPDRISRGAEQHPHEDAEETEADLPEVEAVCIPEDQGKSAEEEVYHA